MLVGGVAPVVAPLAGSLLAGSIGWRRLLWVVAGIAAISLLAAVCVVRETLPPAQRAPRVPGATRVDLRRLANRRFLSAALAYAFASGTMLSFISASPFLYQELMGLSQVTFGVLFGLNALALSVVGALSARLVRKVPTALLARIGLVINLLAIVVMAALVALKAPVIWLTAPLLVAVASLGLVMGNTTALALAHTRGASGLGSAILGLLQFGLAGLLTPLVSLGGASAVPMVVTMLCASVVANLAFAVSRRAAEPSQPAPVRVEA
jgi:DHA1 family bicyclomycin/chloramphenicol resistance-like MFS transporter